MTEPHEQALHALSSLQQVHELYIIKISDQISAAPPPNGQQRTSDVSADAFENPSPASLEADLAHYKELFSKLRFSYLEQVTKEKFIRSIVGDPPLIVSSAENSTLEKELLEIKAVLESQKLDVAELVKKLETQGRDLARRYENIQLQTTQLHELPEQIEALEKSLSELKKQQYLNHAGDEFGSTSGAAGGGQGEIRYPNLSLEKTKEVVRAKEEEAQRLERELEGLKIALLRKTRELERVELELKPLEARRATSMAGAREARRRKELSLGGEVGDDLEERGKWLRSVEGGVREMLGVEG